MKAENIAIKQHKARRRLAEMPFEEKIAALVRMQKIARDMAQSAGRPFRGVVWGPP